MQKEEKIKTKGCTIGLPSYFYGVFLLHCSSLYKGQTRSEVVKYYHTLFLNYGICLSFNRPGEGPVEARRRQRPGPPPATTNPAGWGCRFDPRVGKASTVLVSRMSQLAHPWRRFEFKVIVGQIRSKAGNPSVSGHLRTFS